MQVGVGLWMAAALLSAAATATADDFNTTCNLIQPVGKIRLECFQTRESGVLWTLRPAVYKAFFQLGSFGNLNFYEKSAGNSAPVHMRMVFPRRSQIGFRLKGDELQLRLTSGDILRVSSKTGSFIGMNGAKYDRTNQAFLLKQIKDGLVLSCGRGVKDMPYYKHPKQPCQFTDSSGKSCSFAADEVFSYKNPKEPGFLLDTDAKVERFLATYKPCSGLDRSPLLTATAGASAKAGSACSAGCGTGMEKISEPVSLILNRVRKEIKEGKY